ncbi:MAG: methylase [Clostridiales bacterium]|jgi:hypothetical protein|nr:methylase [Clostridiales bacterium]
MDNYTTIFHQNNYIRGAAVKYAVNYAIKPNPHYRYFAVHGDGGGDCSSFISQCLYAGGAQMIYDQLRPWWYNTNGTALINKHTWSLSWSVANSLYWCLKLRGKSSLVGLKGIEVQNIEALELGDIIQYENYSGAIYHSAIITDFTYKRGIKEPLISQHSFNALNISYIKPKAKRMHLMKIIV